MGKNVSKSLAAVKACIDALPDDVISRSDTQGDDTGELERLMRENDALDEELARAMKASENAIEVLESMHETMVKAILKDS